MPKTSQMMKRRSKWAGRHSWRPSSDDVSWGWTFLLDAYREQQVSSPLSRKTAMVVIVVTIIITTV
jgi:hypothetical protein